MTIGACAEAGPTRASAATDAAAQNRAYPALSEFMMPEQAEIALARSAAPDNVSTRATVKILTAAGFKLAVDGDNGFVCMVLRGWAAPTMVDSTPHSANASGRKLEGVMRMGR